MTIDKLRSIFTDAFVKMCDGCNIQDGWPCRTCFWDALSDSGLTKDEMHALWLIQLKLRVGKSTPSPALFRIRVRRTDAGKKHEMRVKTYQASLARSNT